MFYIVLAKFDYVLGMLQISSDYLQAPLEVSDQTSMQKVVEMF